MHTTLRQRWWLSTIALTIALTRVHVAVADPWLSAGDVMLRDDLQRLSDAGLLHGPTLSWPIGWKQVLAELDRLDPATLSPAQQAAVTRLKTSAVRATRTDHVNVDARLSAAAEPSELRTFEYTPREDGEATLAADWTGERFAWKLAATVVTDPADHQSVRPDGSYIGMSLGNWMLSAGYLERWWGPGWEGSLILSTNARPVPSIALDRISAKPFSVPVLRWLGPWRFSTFMGQLESDREYPNALLFGMRGEIRPFPSLQIAASRTAQWCGEDRPCDLNTFWNLLIGNDNNQPLSEQPGNQLGGFDIRWSWPGGRVPVALYGQGIGEDEAGGFPSKYLGLFGLETWGEAGGGSWRAHVEYADTVCEFNRNPPEFGCAYTNSIYTSGYRYRGRAIGHSMDADGEMVSVGVLYLDSRGNRWELLTRNTKLNREGLAREHSLTAVPARLRDLSLGHERAYSWGNITVSVGYADLSSEEATGLNQGLRGYVSWSHALR